MGVDDYISQLPFPEERPKRKGQATLIEASALSILFEDSRFASLLGMIDLLLAVARMRITVRRLAAIIIIILAASTLALADSRVGDFITTLNMERVSRGLSPLKYSAISPGRQAIEPIILPW